MSKCLHSLYFIHIDTSIFVRLIGSITAQLFTNCLLGNTQLTAATLHFSRLAISFGEGFMPLSLATIRNQLTTHYTKNKEEAPASFPSFKLQTQYKQFAEALWVQDKLILCSLGSKNPSNMFLFIKLQWENINHFDWF